MILRDTDLGHRSLLETLPRKHKDTLGGGGLTFPRTIASGVFPSRLEIHAQSYKKEIYAKALSSVPKHRENSSPHLGPYTLALKNTSISHRPGKGQERVRREGGEKRGSLNAKTWLLSSGGRWPRGQLRATHCTPAASGGNDCSPTSISKTVIPPDTRLRNQNQMRNASAGAGATGQQVRRSPCTQSALVPSPTPHMVPQAPPCVL